MLTFLKNAESIDTGENFHEDCDEGSLKIKQSSAQMTVLTYSKMKANKMSKINSSSFLEVPAPDNKFRLKNV